MSHSHKNGIFLFSALMMSGITLCASATELTVAPATPQVTTTAPVSELGQTLAETASQPTEKYEQDTQSATAAEVASTPNPVHELIDAVSPISEKNEQDTSSATAAEVIQVPVSVQVELPAQTASPVSEKNEQDTSSATAVEALQVPVSVPVQIPAQTASPIEEKNKQDTSSATATDAVPAPLKTSAETSLPPLEKTVSAIPTTASSAQTQSVISEEVTVGGTKAAGIPAVTAEMLNSEEQKRAYASGVMLAHFIEEQLANQKSLHITLDKNILLAGFADTLADQVKMSEEDVRATMSTFDEQVKVLIQAQNEKKKEQEKAYVDAFAKREGVKKSKQGVLYFIDKKGEGPALKDTDVVQVNYKGTLIDGTVVDTPKINSASEIFRIADMPPVLRDSVKLIRKGGQITVVIPPATLEQAKKENGESTLNAVVIYSISVVNVNPQQ